MGEDADEAIRSIFSSNVREIRPRSVVLDLANGESREVENDYVFVFAGGTPPFELLQKMGIRFGGEGS